MSLEKTLVILKPSAVQRGLIGEITHRFERKGLRLAGMKMMQLTEDLLNIMPTWPESLSLPASRHP